MELNTTDKEKWSWEIKPSTKWYEVNFKELFGYKDLIISFFRRDLLSGYHQTLIGIAWIVFQPLLTTIFYFIVFNRIVKVSTDGIPPVLFYLSGSIIWAFFSECFTGTMYSFLFNAHIFNKVYFPRLVVPLSSLLNHLVRFGVQLILFIIIFVVFTLLYIHKLPSITILLLPILIIQLVAFTFGLGLTLSVYVAKYRDIEHLMSFLLRLYMFISPVVYPSTIVPDRFKTIFWLNPLTPIIETFRASFFGCGTIQYKYILISTLSSFLIFTIGIITFKRREIKVMDTI